MPTSHLLILAKYPEPGAVMTRLCPPLSPDDAARLQRSCLRLLCERAFRAWPVQPKLIFSPDDAEDRFRELVGPFIPARPQGEGDLGERMLHAAQTSFADGADEVILVGSDSPTMPAARITDVQRELQKHDAVIGPCDDGGFYVLGLKKTHDEMFSDIAWGGDQACAQTIQRLKSCGLKTTSIDPWYDIDRIDDLRRAVEDIRAAQNLDDYELFKTAESVLATAAKSKPKSKTKAKKKVRA